MKIIQVQFAPWDKAYNFSTAGLELAVGDYVIVETEMGKELGKIISFCAEKENSEEGASKEIKPVLRKAVFDDVASVANQERKDEVMAFCRQAIERTSLPMKLIDVHFSLDGNRMNFAFTSDGRVDFRDLVKELAARFSSNIRLTQIGTRDEAKITGDCGPCGRGLCCRDFLCEFSSITSEMAEAQQVVHRGSERISGMCGRLMCCLSYEYEGYKDLAGQLPPIGTKVNVDGIRGTVCGHHLLKQTVDVKIPPEKADEREITIEVDINRKNKKK
ncbi:MAG: regulatory iron-sulfur-containing complex subunit RicT [Patescibacteria group bacterium]